MEDFIVLAILVGIACLLVPPVLSLIAWSKTSSQEEIIEGLCKAVREQAVLNRQLEARIRQLEAGALPLEPEAEQTQEKRTSPIAPSVTENPAPIEQEAQTAARPAEETLPQAFTAESFFSGQPADPEPSPLPAQADQAAFLETPEAPEPTEIPSVAPLVEPASIAPVQEPRTDAALLATQASTQRHPAPMEPEEPSLIERAFVAAKDWLFGGNTLVRLGLVLVFLGLAFLLSYVSSRIVIPLELRYLGVATASLALLALGWRLREKRPAYALLMQGGAVAVMYLTVFAALKLHGQPLLSTGVGFGLLVAIVALSCVLAVAQDALSLAVAAALGGFATPVLVSTGGGNHIALFSYFALLNLGILGIAWFKAWRPLNLIGFFGTFLIGLAWGLRSYDPALHFASCEAFLALFFLMFVAVGLLFARRMLLEAADTPTDRNTEAWTAWLARQGRRHYVDGTLLFGTPIAAFGLQVGLIRHIEYGTAFSALVLGAFYLFLAFRLHEANPLRHRLLTEVFLALGTIFGSLAIPLALDAQWTSAAWAVEAAGIYWIGHRQNRPLARAFALLLQFGAGYAFLSKLDLPGETSLIEGSALGALMLGASFLSNAWTLRREAGKPERQGEWDSGFECFFNSLGLWSLFAIAPLSFQHEGTVCAWALAGMLTVLLGLRLKARGWLTHGLLVQLLAGWVFLAHLDRGGEGVFVLVGSAWKGLALASLIGLLSLASLGLALREARHEKNEALAHRLAWAMLFGLGFVALAVLFVLPWQTAAAVWAGCGFALLWASMRLKLKPAFWFAIALELAAGIAFLKTGGFWIFDFRLLARPEDFSPFAHAGFWTPIVISLAAFAVAWRLHAWARSPAAGEADAIRIDGEWLSFPALLWSAAWWSFGWWMELARISPAGGWLAHDFLGLAGTSALILLPIALKWNWSRLAGLCGLLLPLIALTAFVDYVADRSLLANHGWLGLGLSLAACLGLLRLGKNLFQPHRLHRLHLLNFWVWLGVVSLISRYVFLSLGEPGSAWRWLGWVLPLAAWLLWQTREAPARLWPFSTDHRLYRFTATLPPLLIQLFWLFQANLHSAGNAAPLPFLPLLNPLDLALIFTLFAAWQWGRQLEAQNPEEYGWQAFHEPLKLALFAGAFLTYTCAVLRGVSHFGLVPWEAEALMASMTAQASLSIAWALLALGLMISGHRHERRPVWISGAVLIALVVAKLFFIELSNRGGLERIVSFLGVGILLLVVGYFAPLPPHPEDSKEAQS